MAKNLTAFLAQNAKKIDNVTFIASDRFVDPDTGEAMPWEICCITAAENAGLRKACMRTVPVPGRKGQFTQDFDANAYLAKVAVRCTVFPNLNDAELQQSYGIMGAEQLITTMLKLYNTKTRSLSISDALGDTRVRAGSSVIVKLGLGDINVQSYLLVESVTHKFKQEQHLMDLKLRGGTFVT